MKLLLTLIGLTGLCITLYAADGTPEAPDAPVLTQTQTWEQKQEAIKECAGEIIQLKEQIQSLIQQKEAASTGIEKAQIQDQIQQAEGTLTMTQNQYQKLLADQTAYKYEFKDGNGDGVNDNVQGTNDPNAKSYMYKNGYGYGYGFVDADGDGINDNFVDADGDGLCDTEPKMLKTRLQSRSKARGQSQTECDRPFFFHKNPARCRIPNSFATASVESNTNLPACGHDGHAAPEQALAPARGGPSNLRAMGPNAPLLQALPTRQELRHKVVDAAPIEVDAVPVSKVVV